MPEGPAAQLRAQWVNPSDILSLLLLIGGDVVQKAISQMVGYTIKLPGRAVHGIPVTPVAFSFGWVAYAFNNLLSAVGEKRLMAAIDCPSIVVNCENAFRRTNQSWILGRLLRDHESRHEVDQRDPTSGTLPSSSPTGRAESVRIDIFELRQPSSPSIDAVWLMGWAVMAIQIGLAVPPWVLDGNWGIMMISLTGNVLALLTCALPEWRDEKWAGRKLTKDNVTCLTRGNGYPHIMVFIGRKGCWSIESLATGTSIPHRMTPFLSLILTILWTCLLISVSGLKDDTWYLVGIGGIGMLQNMLTAGVARTPNTSNIHLTPFSPMPTIIGKRQRQKDDDDSVVNVQATVQELGNLYEQQEGQERPNWKETVTSEISPQWLQPLQALSHNTANVQGALIELEKWVPTAGLAMVQVYFPTSLQYDAKITRDNIHKKFWKRAYATGRMRREVRERRSQVNMAVKRTAKRKQPVPETFQDV